MVERERAQLREKREGNSDFLNLERERSRGNEIIGT